jgi:ribosomal protein S10
MVIRTNKFMMEKNSRESDQVRKSGPTAPTERITTTRNTFQNARFAMVIHSRLIDLNVAQFEFHGQEIF